MAIQELKKRSPLTIKRHFFGASLLLTNLFYGFNKVQAQCGDLTVEGGVNCAKGNTSGDPLTASIANIVNILLVVVGMAAVIAIIIGGLRYILSQGNEKSIEGAKSTILYAVIGLVVAVLAYAIVNFVLVRL